MYDLQFWFLGLKLSQLVPGPNWAQKFNHGIQTERCTPVAMAVVQFWLQNKKRLKLLSNLIRQDVSKSLQRPQSPCTTWHVVLLTASGSCEAYKDISAVYSNCLSESRCNDRAKKIKIRFQISKNRKGQYAWRVTEWLKRNRISQTVETVYPMKYHFIFNEDKNPNPLTNPIKII